MSNGNPAMKRQSGIDNIQKSRQQSLNEKKELKGTSI